MKRTVTFAVAAVLIVTACSDHDGLPVNAYQRWQDRLAIFFGVGWPCEVRHQDRSGSIWAPLPTDQCLRMDPVRRWSGTWRYSKDERFCVRPPNGPQNCNAYFQIEGSEVRRATARPSGSPLESGLFAIDFLGRRNSVEGAGGRHVYIVDRIISLKKIADVPRDDRVTRPGAEWSD